MNVKVRLTKLDYLKELSSQTAITQTAKRQEREKLQIAKKVGAKLQETGDLKELRKLIQSLGENFEWEESTLRWLKDSKPYDFVCINMRLAGIDPRKERYCFWGVMSFSKAPVERFDHLGDLERVVFEKDEKNEFMALSTIIHGVPDQYWEYIGKYNSINEAISDPKIQFLFEPGDHSIYVDKPKLRVKLLGFSIPDNFFIIRKLFAVKEVLLINIPCITHEHVEEILKINLYEYTKLTVELDTLIQMQWKSQKISEQIKGSFKNIWSKLRLKKVERSYIGYLYFLYHVLWRVPLNNQLKYLKILGKLFKETYDSRKILINIEPLIAKLISMLDEMHQQIQFLTWQSFSNAKKFAQRFGVEKIKGLSTVAAESIPVAIEKVFTKSLDDIGYPEKGSPRMKIQRLTFWSGGHSFRILQLIRQKARKFTKKVFNKIRRKKDEPDKKELQIQKINKKNESV